MPKLDDVLTISQAAKAAGVAKATIYNWIRNGYLRTQRLGSMSVLTKDELARAVKKRRRPGRPRAKED